MRRRARQQGLKLVKARTHSREHPVYGTFMLLDSNTNEIVVARDPVTLYGLTLDDVAVALEGRD